jgi:ribosomal protein S14
METQVTVHHKPNPTHKKATQKNLPATTIKKINRCMSCGTTKNMSRRKYCSMECRQKLRHKLDMRAGLLQALNARYATFHFTEGMIVMDVLPYGIKEIYSFFFPRSPHRKPADDFCKMANSLGDAWWTEQRRTNKNYLASLFVLNQADRKDLPSRFVKPLATRIPNIKETVLVQMKLNRSSLSSPDLRNIIRTSYRQQAKQHHPDVGGDATTFRKVQEAYETIASWAENPSYIHRRGFPDKWFYDGEKNKWVQPTLPRGLRT